MEFKWIYILPFLYLLLSFYLDKKMLGYEINLVKLLKRKTTFISFYIKHYWIITITFYSLFILLVWGIYLYKHPDEYIDENNIKDTDIEIN